MMLYRSNWLYSMGAGDRYYDYKSHKLTIWNFPSKPEVNFPPLTPHCQ